MFYIGTKNGIYPLTSSLTISKVGKFIDTSGNEIEIEKLKDIKDFTYRYRIYYDVRHSYDVIATFDNEKEAQNLIENIQQAINNGESYYYVNEV